MLYLHLFFSDLHALGDGVDGGEPGGPRPEFVLLELLKDRWSHVCEALEHKVNALGERGSAWGVHWGLTGEVGVKLTDVVI